MFQQTFCGQCRMVLTLLRERPKLEHRTWISKEYLNCLNHEEIDNMRCEKCNENMNWFLEGSIQGWLCPGCGWNLVTTYIDVIYNDMTEYSVYIKEVTEIDKEKIKLIAKIAGVNFVIAKQMLIKNNACILKAKAVEVKNAIEKLREAKIQFEVSPVFKY